MLTESQHDAARAETVRMRNHLHRMLARHRGGCTIVQPAELSSCMWHGSWCWLPKALFVHAACQAVGAKYARAGYHGIALRVRRLQAVVAGMVDQASTICPWLVDTGESRWPAGPLVTHTRRVSVHATRCSYGGDNDLHLAGVDRHTHSDFTAWVFQQDDMRFRWSADACRRMDHMLACWDAYSRCAFTRADTAIALQEFPLSDRLCHDRMHQAVAGRLRPDVE